MAYYRNKGGPWRRSGDEVVPPLGIFDATEKEMDRIARRPGYRDRFVPVAETTAAPPVMAVMVPPAEQAFVPVEPPAAEEEEPYSEDEELVDDEEDAEEDEEYDAEEEPEEDWPLKLSPARYLELYPAGKRAALARRLTAASPAAWPLKLPPERYLQLYPAGKHAALAHRLLD